MTNAKKEKQKMTPKNVRGRLPLEYRPFDELLVCSNRFVGGLIPIAVNDQPALLIGKGTYPLVWIAAKQSGSTNKWVYVVAENRSMKQEIVVTATGDQTSVMLGGSLLLEVRKAADTIAIVTQLNLRPIGLDIYGAENFLNVGGSTLARNSFTNVSTMIAVKA